MSEIALDIETAAWEPGVEAALADLGPFTAPANYKDPDKIAAYIKEKETAERAKIRANAPLSDMTGRVVAFGVHNDNHQRAVAMNAEKSLLEELRKELMSVTSIVTFNGHSFDTNFLRNRMMVHGVFVPHVLLPESPWYPKRHIDVRLVLTGGDQRGEGTLTARCRQHGIEPPIPHNGEDIAKLVAADNMARLREIVASDVRATWQLFTRAQAVGLITAGGK